MSIEFKTGDILCQEADGLINTVNCVGVMGKGIALQFKKAFPGNFKVYADACKRGDVVTGKMFVYDIASMFSGQRYIINFPTKKHWRAPSKLEYIKTGLVDLVEQIKKLKLKSVAIPALGCGNGGLSCDIVKPLIIQSLSIPEFSDLQVFIYEPSNAYIDTKTINRGNPPKMTKLYASICKMIGRYKTLDYSLSHIEIQKLIYFFEVTGIHRSLNFKKHTYGPYSELLKEKLDKMDGFYIDGFKSHQNATIVVKEDIKQKVNDFIDTDPELKNRYERVSSLIQGYENPFGMELLATVHWVCTQEKAYSLNDAIKQVTNWSPRKKEIFTKRHIRIAYDTLKIKGWI